MRTSLAVMVCLLVAALATTAVAQEPPSQYERLEQLEPYVGFWQGDFQPSDGAAGTLFANARWTSNRSYVQIQWSFQADDAERTRRVPMVTVVLGWDGKHEQIRCWTFHPAGALVGPVSVTDDGMVINEAGTTFEGEPMSNKATYKIEGDQLKVTITDSKIGGESKPDMSLTLTKRERRRRQAQ